MPKKKTESPDPMKRVQDAIDALQDRVSKLEQTVKGKSGAGSESALPPLPKKQGKKFEGERKDIRCRIDASLYRLLDEMAEKECGGNMSRCLDVILWNFFNRPELSFQALEKID